jgi:uncharacterized protein
VGATRFLARRFAILFAIGLCHLLAIWNGDILTLYAVCGFLLLPILHLPTAALAAVGVASVTLTFIAPWERLIPGDKTMYGLAAEAALVYANGGFGDVLVFHWRETGQLILPLLVAVLPRTWGLMALGAATWRAGVFREPGKHLGLLWVTALAGGVIGGSATALEVYSSSTGRPTVLPPLLVQAGSSVPLALAYAAVLILAMRTARVAAFTATFAVAGQMALTNYLTQSVILGFLFYSCGLGLYGHLGSAAAAVIGVILFLGQLGFSRAWLQRYQFGPMEWLWRSLTYGRRQPMRRITTRAGCGRV